MIKRVAVLIIHFKDSPHTLACLNSLKKAHEVSEFDIYILASQCQQPLEFSTHPLHPTIITESKNQGYAWANNILIRRAMAENYQILVLLNNDTIVDPNFLPPLIDALENQKIGMVCPKIYFSPKHEYYKNEYSDAERGKVIWFAGGVIDWANAIGFHQAADEVDHGQWSKVTNMDVATGCCIALTRQTINLIGLIPENYFLYYEDADWSLRARNKGLELQFVPQSMIWHVNAGSTNGPGSTTHVYYQERNRLVFGLIYAPFRTKIHLAINAVKQMWRPDPTLRKASQDGLFHRLGKRD